jgi:hypothetical protein
MSAITAIDQVPVRSRPGGKVTQSRVLRSEWIKLWSLRSTRWSLAAGLLGLLLGIVVAIFDMSRWSTLPLDTRLHYKSVDTALIGWHLSELAIGVLGVLVITGEYSTGMIRSTFMAVPRRLPVLWAKVLVFATVVLVLSIPMTFIGFFGASAVMGQHHVNPSLSSPGALRAVIAIPLFLTVLAVFTVSLGRRDRDLRRHHLRAPRVGRRAVEQPEEQHQPVPALQRRIGVLHRDARSSRPPPATVGRICGVLRLRADIAVCRCGAAGQTGRLSPAPAPVPGPGPASGNVGSSVTWDVERDRVR